MKHVLMLVLTLLSMNTYSNDYDEGRIGGLSALNGSLPGLNQINPNEYFDKFTNSPTESQLNHDNLKELGLSHANNSQIAKEIMSNYHTRERIKINPNSPEMKFAEKVITDADNGSNEICYKEPEHCDESSKFEICHQNVSYIEKQCTQKLTVTVNQVATHEVNRYKIANSNKVISFNLGSCEPSDWYCNSQQLIQFSAKCEVLKTNISLIWGNADFKVIQAPSCSNPVLIIELSQYQTYWIGLTIKINEFETQDSWSDSGCGNDTKNAGQYCVSEATNQCVDKNQTKIINGIAVTRACWGRAEQYRCIGNYSGCENLNQQGCSQVKSKCVQATNNHCDEFEQTYQCSIKTCFPEKTVCKEKLPCADGSCMPTSDENGDDFAEGISRLGALAGSADEVSKNQVTSGSPSIFTGSNDLCRVAVAGIGNCCGGNARFLRCRQGEKDLAVAKESGRAAYVGTYCAHKKLGVCVEHKQSWCTFPSKLAAIVQIQGRKGQKGINFGWAANKTNAANCRGITPEELETIDFSQLNLDSLTEEFKSKKRLPDSSVIDAKAGNKVDQMNRRGKPHG